MMPDPSTPASKHAETLKNFRTINPNEFLIFRQWLYVCPDHVCKFRLLTILLGGVVNETGEDWASPEAEQRWCRHLKSEYERMIRWVEQCMPGEKPAEEESKPLAEGVRDGAS